MWFAPAKVVEERRSICSACKFAKRESTGLWCGTPKYKSFKGDIVTYRKKKYELCGCNMFLKTGFKNQSCPVGKWSSVGSLNDDDKNEIRAFLKTVNTDYISQIGHPRIPNAFYIFRPNLYGAAAGFAQRAG